MESQRAIDAKELELAMSQTGKEMKMHVEKDGKQYAMVPPEEAAAAVQVTIDHFLIYHVQTTLAEGLSNYQRWCRPRRPQPPCR